MLMNKFLEDRRSIREFEEREIDPQIIESIKQDIDFMEEEEGSSDIEFRLYEYGKNVYENLENKAGYGGVMIKSPHYIALVRKNSEDLTIISGAYHLEKLVTRLNSYGLGTCWVSVHSLDDETKQEVFGDIKGDIDFILAIGYPKRRRPYKGKLTSEKLSIEELVFQNEICRNALVDELEANGLIDLFYYVRYSPSNKNLQPWRFLLEDDGKVTLLLGYCDWDNSLLVDAGVIMYYFEELAKRQGSKSKWQLIEPKEEEVCGKKYRYIAEYQL